MVFILPLFPLFKITFTQFPIVSLSVVYTHSLLNLRHFAHSTPSSFSLASNVIFITFNLNFLTLSHRNLQTCINFFLAPSNFMFHTNGIKICQIVLSANSGDVFHIDIDITFKPKTVRLAFISLSLRFQKLRQMPLI